MAKYRVLNSDELGALEKEFIDFLIVNGVTADDWLTLKGNHPDKAYALIESFSDVIFEGIFRKLKYLEYIDQNGIKIFKCESDKIMLIGIESVEGNSVDFSDRHTLLNIMKSNPELFNIYRAAKAYFPDRNTELFKMIQTGNYVSDGAWYEAMDKFI